jgi:hypothetical protein
MRILGRGRATVEESMSDKRKFPEVQSTVRGYIRECEMTVRQLSVALSPIKESRIYDWVEGRRSMDGWEYEIWIKRTGKHINYRDLRGENYEGLVKKNHGSQLTFEDLRRIK